MAYDARTFDGASPLIPSRIEGAIDRAERWRVTGRFGDLSAGALSAIIYKRDQGWLDDWADLCEYALCDDTLMSLYASRANRVLQASWKVKPNQFGNPAQAKLAAEFCEEQMGRMTNFTSALRYMFHAMAIGLSASAKEWDSYRAPTGQLTYYLRKVHFRHPHRFRYDEQWQPRLYDQGRQTMYPGANMWGRALDPRKWLVYQHYEIVGYPNVSGFMCGAIWVWLFRRWADKFGIQSLERFGDPFLYAKVPANTPGHTRERIRQDLENLSNDHAGVVDIGVEIANLAGMSAQSDSMHGTFMDRYEKRLTRLILGTSDATDPGANGSNAAVATRAGAVTDPRMVVDGMSLGETWASQVFGWMLEFNRHRFGGELLPVPTFEAQTASDEVKTDQQDLVEQQGGGGFPAPPGGTPNVDSGATSEAKSEGATEAATVQDAPAKMSSTADPKALSRSAQGRRTSRQAQDPRQTTITFSPQAETSPTSTRSAPTTGGILRSALAARQKS